MKARGVMIGVAALVVAAVLVLVGRWERAHRAHVQVRGIRHVLAEVGRLDARQLDAFRYLTDFQCLLYRRGKNPFALELCIDSRGRVIEAIDRRGASPRIWSVRDDPGRSTVRVNRDEVDHLLVDLGVPPRLVRVARARGS